MKKVIFILVAMLGIASANAQFKDSGLKTIVEVGLGASTACADGASAFGFISPTVDLSIGANLAPKFFLGGGVGYNTLLGATNFEGTEHAVKAFAHGRCYFTSEGKGAIADVKVGYNRNLTSKANAAEVFVGPGYLFGGKYNLSIGYTGTFYDGLSLHGGALKFGIEF